MSLASKTVKRSPTLGSSASSPMTLGDQNSNSDRSGMDKPSQKVSTKTQCLLLKCCIRMKTRLKVGSTRGGNNKENHWYRVTHSFPVLTILRKSIKNELRKLSRPQRDDMLEININSMIWRIFMSATANAAVHLGQDYQENIRTTKNTESQTVVRYLAEIDPGSQK